MPKRLKRRSDTKRRVGRDIYEVRRGSSSSQGYDADWERIAKRRRQLDYYLCQECLKRGLSTSAKDVDHIIPLHVRLDWRLEIDNTQVLCRMHHRAKTERDNELFGSSTEVNVSAIQQARRDAARRLQEPLRGPGAGQIVTLVGMGTRAPKHICAREFRSQGVKNERS
ncbi:HNH endonuclease [Bremerella sp. P1]|uniref:HNH endonuclease n=1 Tax=Bremerella sp. P1 TaxID=3026424 RepID=UPI003FCDC7EB